MIFKKTSTEKKMTKIPPKSASPEKIDVKWSKASSINNNHQTKVWTVHGEPGYCVAYTTSWNKKFKGFDHILLKTSIGIKTQAFTTSTLWGFIAERCQIATSL